MMPIGSRVPMPAPGAPAAPQMLQKVPGGMPGGMPGAMPGAGQMPMNPAALAGLLQKIRGGGAPAAPGGMPAPGAPC